MFALMRPNILLPSISSKSSAIIIPSSYSSSSPSSHPTPSLVSQNLRLGRSLRGRSSRRLQQRLLLLATPVVVVKVAVALRQLRTLVDKVAGKEQVVARLHGQRVAHEDARVDDERASHLARDAVRGGGRGN